MAKKTLNYNTVHLFYHVVADTKTCFKVIFIDNTMGSISELIDVWNGLEVDGDLVCNTVVKNSCIVNGISWGCLKPNLVSAKSGRQSAFQIRYKSVRILNSRIMQKVFVRDQPKLLY